MPGRMVRVVYAARLKTMQQQHRVRLTERLGQRFVIAQAQIALKPNYNYIRRKAHLGKTIERGGLFAELLHHNHAVVHATLRLHAQQVNALRLT